MWASSASKKFIQSAGLYTEDHTTGKNGFDLAAVMLLGRDEIIRDVCPAYRTDALVRKVNIDRYDDRLTVVTNLVESFEQLFEFATLHPPDKFHVEGAERKSLRNLEPFPKNPLIASFFRNIGYSEIPHYPTVE